jgi:hypothetical protein
LKSKVSLVIEGIPPHAWDIAVVEDFLGKSCAMDEVAQETKARTECEAIPVARMLAVPEPVLGGGVRSALARSAVAGARGAGQASGDINMLQYRILIHITRVEDELGVRLERALDPSGRGSEGQRESSEMEAEMAAASLVVMLHGGLGETHGGTGSQTAIEGQEEDEFRRILTSSRPCLRQRRRRRRAGLCQPWTD